MILIHGGRLLTFTEEKPYIDDGAIAVDGSVIKEIGSSKELLAKYGDAEMIGAEGGVIMPALVNAHTHICRALGMGMPAPFLSGSYEQNEARYAFDAKLDFDGMIESAYALMTESVKNGVGCVIDMLTGVRDPRGILLVIAGIANDIGLRACLGCGVTKRNGEEAFSAALGENKGFAEYCRTYPSELIRPAFGVDLLYTLDDNDLYAILRAAEGRLPLQISVSDGPDDVFYSKRSFGRLPVERLNDLGLLTENTVLAHCGCLCDKEAELIAESGACAVHTPLSDELKDDLSPAFDKLIKLGAPVGLGTDALTSDALMLPRAAVHGLVGKVSDPFLVSVEMLTKGCAVAASRIFGMPLGVLRPGAAADIIIMNYDPCTSFSVDNAHLHMLRAMSGAQCTFNMVNGRILMREGKLLTCTEKYCRIKTRAASERLWNK